MDRGAWWATVDRVTKSRTQLNDWARDHYTNQGPRMDLASLGTQRTSCLIYMLFYWTLGKAILKLVDCIKTGKKPDVTYGLRSTDPWCNASKTAHFLFSVGISLYLLGHLISIGRYSASTAGSSTLLPSVCVCVCARVCAHTHTHTHRSI